MNNRPGWSCRCSLRPCSRTVRTRDQVIAADLYKNRTRAEKSGVPPLVLQHMKPWMAAVTLTAPALKAAGFDTGLGVDSISSNGPRTGRPGATGARDRGLSVRSPRSDVAGDPGSDAAVVDRRSRNEVANVKDIAEAWSRGDTATIEKLLLGALHESPELYERLLAEHNRNGYRVEACIKQQAGCFVVVGAAHLVGPHICRPAGEKGAIPSSSSKIFSTSRARQTPDLGD